MTDMGVGHDQIVIADTRETTTLNCAAVDRAIFTELIKVADFEPDPLTAVGQVLGIAAHDGERMNVMFLSELRRPFHHRMRFEHTAVPELDFLADDGVWPDANVGTQPGRGRNDSPRVNLSVNLFHRAFSAGAAMGTGSASMSTILHIRVASAASSPLTDARP